MNIDESLIGREFVHFKGGHYRLEVLVIDEIQESASTLTSLKFFNGELPELAVMAAGSLLGLAVGRAEEDEERGRPPAGGFACPRTEALLLRFGADPDRAIGSDCVGVMFRDTSTLIHSINY